MAKIITLNMLSDESDSFIRTYEIEASSTLFDLHDLISGDLGLEPDMMPSFFASDGEWGRLVEYTLMDMGGGTVSMSEMGLEAVAGEPHDRLIYMFDLIEDRSTYLESSGESEAAQGVEYPRVARRVGAIAGLMAGGDEGGSIFDDAMDGFNDFDGDDNYDDDI